MARLFLVSSRVYAPPPTAPQLLASVSGSVVTLTFSAVPAPGQVASYTVERSAIAAVGPFSLLAVTRAGSLQTTESPGTYYYRAIATQNDGQQSAYSGVASASVSAQAGVWAPNFPALAAYYISQSDWSNSANDAKLAPLACVVYQFFYTSGDQMPVRMAATRALTPAGVGVTPSHQIYVVQNESYPVSAAYYTEYRNKLDAENWWLRTSYPAGSIVNAYYVGNQEVNNTGGSFADVDSNGKDWIHWHCDTIKTQNVTGGSLFGYTLPANPYLDANYCDNIFWQKRVDGDYNRDGTSEDNEAQESRDTVRAGYKRYADYMRQILPDHPVIGNMDFYMAEGGALYSASYTPDFTKIGDLYQLFEGGLGHEHLLENSTSSFEWAERNDPEVLKGFHATRNAMRFMYGAVREPRRLMFSVRDVTHDNSAADNQRLRFGLALVLVCSNGMIDDTGALSANSASNPIYTDSGAGHGWLGQPVSESPNWTPDGQGLYAREFTNGWAVVNPRNNGAKTFTLGQTVRSVPDNQVFNAGTPISIADRDGRLLRKV